MSSESKKAFFLNSSFILISKFQLTFTLEKNVNMERMSENSLSLFSLVPRVRIALMCLATVLGLHSYFPTYFTPQKGLHDKAPFMLMTQPSIADVASRITGINKVDVFRFRPNILVDGCEAYDEVRVRSSLGKIVLSRNYRNISSRGQKVSKF